MNQSDALQLAIGIITNAALTGFVVGLVIWFFTDKRK